MLVTNDRDLFGEIPMKPSWARTSYGWTTLAIVRMIASIPMWTRISVMYYTILRKKLNQKRSRYASEQDVHMHAHVIQLNQASQWRSNDVLMTFYNHVPKMDHPSPHTTKLDLFLAGSLKAVFEGTPYSSGSRFKTFLHQQRSWRNPSTPDTTAAV